MATGAANRSYRFRDDLGFGTVPIYNADATISEGDLLVDDGDGTISVVADTNTSEVIGVAACASTAATVVSVYPVGIFEVKLAASANLAANGPAYAASASTVDAGSSSDVAVGRVMCEEPAAAASPSVTSVQILVISTLFFTKKIHA